MIVVADTGPLHYLALIGQANVLATLYERVLVPTKVIEEMLQVPGAAGLDAQLSDTRSQDGNPGCIGSLFYCMIGPLCVTSY